MKKIIVERVECDDDDDIPDAIVVGIERNDGKGYEDIWMGPDNAIDFANDIIRLANISIYRFNKNMKNGNVRNIKKRSDIKIIKRK